MILAEGAPAETWLDTGDRGNFDGETAPLVLYPDFAGYMREAGAFAPLVTTGPALEVLRRRLDTIGGDRMNAVARPGPRPATAG